MSLYTSIDSLAHTTEKQAFISLQTGVRIVDNKMAAGTDHYLEVIKLRRLSVACQQLSNYFVNWKELFMGHKCQLGMTEPPVDVEAWLNKTFKPFRQTGMSAWENEAIH